MKVVDKFRIEVLSRLSEIPSLRDSWSQFSSSIDAIVGSNPNANQIFLLGEHLSTIFQSNSDSGRTQSQVSGGGAAWECLVTWYLNLIFWGTDVIVTKQNRNSVPQVITESLCVTIANHQTNTESDIVIYSIPNTKNLAELSLDDIDELIRADIKNVDLAVVQCKTNWNDNAQIPMLWDLIYNSTNFRIPNVFVGINGVKPTSFKNFTYSFVTVPTTTRTRFTSTNLAVLRVNSLTGGNYWGKPTQQGVALCINNFFGRNFGNYFNGGVQTHITNQINLDSNYYKRFRNLSF
jgi:hypothetical protein